MDGWVDGWMGGWMDGWLDRWMHINGQLHGCIDTKIHVDEWLHYTEGERKAEKDKYKIDGGIA
jgi:hypothetical protein